MKAHTAEEIARFICTTRYGDIDADAIAYTKLLALSQLGMTVAGHRLESGRIAAQYVREQAPDGHSAVVGGGFLTTPEMAALANGTLSHATELEDDSFPEGLYTCGLFPAVFALGEKLAVSGADVLAAFIIGWDVASKLGRECADAVGRGWLNSAIWDVIGSAAGAARLLGLDVHRTTMALSIAASQAGGIARQTGTGAHLLEAGTAGRNGICAALLAAMGFTGNPTILEGTGGLCDLVAGKQEFELSLGYPFRVMEVGIKKYPCCYLMQRNIDGVWDLVREHQLSLDEVERIDVHVNRTFSLYMKYPQPADGELARFSIEHSVAACFLESRVFLDTYTDEKAHDAVYEKARRKVRMVVHDDWAPGYFSFDSPVVIRMRDGKEYRKVCVTARGDPSSRMTPAQVLEKYWSCIEYSGLLSNAEAQRAADMTLALQDLRDVRDLMRLLAFPGDSVRQNAHRC